MYVIYILTPNQTSFRAITLTLTLMKKKRGKMKVLVKMVRKKRQKEWKKVENMLTLKNESSVEYFS